MKVVLTEDIEKLGKKYEVKSVKDGYARNFLFPKNLAKIATKEVLAWALMQKETVEKKAEEDLKEIQKIASEIEGTEFTISIKLGDKGQFFEKLNEQKILEKIKEQGFNIKKNQLTMENPIEELGEFPLKIKFDHNLEAEITVIVVEEKEK